MEMSLYKHCLYDWLSAKSIVMFVTEYEFKEKLQK